jgi:hypothetical protein
MMAERDAVVGLYVLGKSLLRGVRVVRFFVVQLFTVRPSSQYAMPSTKFSMAPWRSTVNAATSRISPRVG